MTNIYWLEGMDYSREAFVTDRENAKDLELTITIPSSVLGRKEEDILAYANKQDGIVYVIATYAYNPKYKKFVDKFENFMKKLVKNT